MLFDPMQIPDVVLITPEILGDSRDFQFATWDKKSFAAASIGSHFVQDNQSASSKNTLRGFGYQIRNPQGKLVRVVRGAVFDVAVDLRCGSRSFGRWTSTVLSEDNHCLLWMPPGFAHGFLVLSEFAVVLYRCTEFWSPAHERTIIWSDPELNVHWPLTRGAQPLLSEKDAAGVRFRDAEHFP